MLRQIDKINGVVIQKITHRKLPARYQNVPENKVGKGAKFVTPFDTLWQARDAAKVEAVSA